MRQPSAQPVGRYLLVTMVAVSGALLATLVCSCSVKDNYKTLSFFFDGVPDPNGPPRNSRGMIVVADLSSSPTYSVHKPYQDGACDACHSTSYQLTSQDSAVCLKCHQAKTGDKERMHGPVAAGACLWCHTGHESAEAHLLKAPARTVCTQCHEPGVLNTVSVPQHADATKSCLECHFGHGSDSTYFLRPGSGGMPARSGAPAPGPAEQPVSVPGRTEPVPTAPPMAPPIAPPAASPEAEAAPR